MSLFARFLGDRRGNIAVLFAGGFAAASVISAFTVDAASLYHARRVMQHRVDLAAIAAAAHPAAARTIAYDALRQAGAFDPDLPLSALSNPAGDMGLVVETGNYLADASLPPGNRFRPGMQPVNAVRVGFHEPGALFFAQSWSPVPRIGASAIATVTPQVAFSVGSRLLSLNGGIANALLNKLLGTSVNLTVLDYNGLANVRVDALAFLDALAFRLGITAGTYDDILAASADHGEIANALADILNGTQRAAAKKIGNAAGGNGTVPLSRLFDLGDLGHLAIGSAGQNLYTDISALELLAVSAGLSDGASQVSLAIAAGVPGIAGIDATLAIGEPPQGDAWFAVGSVGAVARTAQLRLKLEVRLLGSPLLLGAGVRLPLYLEIAPAEAMVSSASCPSGNGASGSATILARPGVARLVLGDVNPASLGNFNTPPNIGLARLIDILLLKVTGKAHAEIAETTPVPLSFSPSEIASNTVKTAKTTSFIGSLVGSLLGTLELNVAGLSLGVVTAALQALLTPLTPALDLIINTLLETLGLSLGEADVQVYGVRCSQAVLVG